MLRRAKKSFENKVEKLARRNIISKLNREGIQYKQLEETMFNSLVSDEIKILKNSNIFLSIVDRFALDRSHLF